MSTIHQRSQTRWRPAELAAYISGLAGALARQPDVEVCVATSFASGLDLPDTVDVIDLSPHVRRFRGRIAWRERSLAGLAASWNASVVIAPTPEVPVRRLRVPIIVVATTSAR